MTRMFCILAAIIAIGAPAASAQEAPPPPPTNEQCEQAQRDVESLRPALADANNQVAAKESRVTSRATVPDSILVKSRISVMRRSRSVPEAWIVRENSTCRPVR